MLSLTGSLKVFLAVEPCDMRKGFEGLGLPPEVRRIINVVSASLGCGFRTGLIRCQTERRA
jgi:hypothetical protein